MSPTPYSAKKFSLPEVTGISSKTIETHIKLYEGYVKHANTILEKLESLSDAQPEDHLTLLALQRRFSFEFDGMRNHEYYFGALEGGPRSLSPDSLLAQALTKTWGSVDAGLARLKTVATTRGIGWAMLSYDPASQQLLTSWVDEQHLGQLTGLSPIVALDVWEHAYLLDYAPADKAKYVEAYLAALNWETVNGWFEEAVR